MLAKVKRWGNSLGLIVPAEVAMSKGLRDGDVIEVQFGRRARSPAELEASVHFRNGIRKLIQEMEAGWEDI